jgi:hypothetical protein
MGKFVDIKDSIQYDTIKGNTKDTLWVVSKTRFFLDIYHTGFCKEGKPSAFDCRGSAADGLEKKQRAVTL